MSAAAVPKKPPRGHKSGKETGILMTVIKTLSSSATSDDRDRDREKTKLEKEYKLSDQRLDVLIASKQDSLNRATQTFSHICSQIEEARQRLHGVKVSLQKCKMLLHCGRGELEHLWLEGIEHKHALEILEQIDQLRNATPQYNKLLGRKQYSQAAEILVNSLGSWNDRLEQIEGLREARADLNAKKDKLYDLLLEELNNELYVKSSPTVVEMKRQGSGHFALFQRTSSDRQSSGRNRMNQIKARKIYFDINVPNSNGLGLQDQKSLGESEELNTFMAMVINCMVLLNELPKFISDLRGHLNERLLGAISHISQQIIEYTDSNGMRESGETLFMYLLQLIFNQFRTIVGLHTQLLSFLTRAIQENRLNVQVVTTAEIWGGVQAVLQQTLKIYFDLSDSKSPHQPSIPSSTSFRATAEVVDISSYFSKKKQQRQKKIPLFKFEYSLHGLNTNEMMNHESSDRSLMDKHRFLVCKPNPRNIIVIYNTVQEFISEVEEALNGEKCELRNFMSYNVERVFIKQIYKEISDVLELVKKSPDTWKEVTLTEDAKTLKCVRPIFRSVVMMGRSIMEVLTLVKDLPSHCDQLLLNLNEVLADFRKICQEIYGTVVAQSETDDKYVVSAMWVKDDDIQRLLKSLPNWENLEKQIDGKLEESITESPDDLRSQNIRESDLLYGVFGGKKLQNSEVLTGLKQMEQLAHLQESMDWFSETILSVAATFQETCKGTGNMKASIDSLHSLASEFQDLASTCLLVLHLEVRVYCFYYLSPLFQKGGEFAPGVDNQSADIEVVHFTKTLKETENILNSALQPVKSKYVFEGLGQLVASVLIRGAQDINRINENGVKKICRDIFSIRQTLCNITHQPEQALDHARHFYELFLRPIDELFDTILERGPQFKELEYMNVIKVLHKTKPGKESLNECHTRLSNILNDVGVTGVTV